MKRILLAVLTALTLSLPAAAAPRTVPVTVDGALLGGVSYLESGVTTVPLRTLLDALGGWTVRWDSAARQAVAEKDGVTLTAKPGETHLTVDGAVTDTPAAVYVLNGRTYVPLRALGQAMGWAVEWDSALGGASLTTGAAGAAYSDEDLYWLSRVISAESQGESLTGQLAVGSVVMNRVASADFPNTVRAVVFDRTDGVQFEPVSNGTIYDTPTAQSVAAARAVLSGTDSVVGDCLYFYAPALSAGTWINANRTYYTTIGCHRFYL
jgi:N-acetylmuramoyl-L-alanine amidase